MDEVLPSVFIGSSTEGIDVARGVELQLPRVANTTLWENGVFLPGTGNLETLMSPATVNLERCRA
jgi:hypothetical protein